MASLVRYAARNENFVRVVDEPHNGPCERRRPGSPARVFCALGWRWGVRPASAAKRLRRGLAGARRASSRAKADGAKPPGLVLVLVSSRSDVGLSLTDRVTERSFLLRWNVCLRTKPRVRPDGPFGTGPPRGSRRRVGRVAKPLPLARSSVTAQPVSGIEWQDFAPRPHLRPSRTARRSVSRPRPSTADSGSVSFSVEFGLLTAGRQCSIELGRRDPTTAAANRDRNGYQRLPFCGLVIA